METDGNNAYCGKHRIMHRIVQSLHCTPETNITLCTNYASKKERKKLQSSAHQKWASEKASHRQGETTI